MAGEQRKLKPVYKNIDADRLADADELLIRLENLRDDKLNNKPVVLFDQEKGLPRVNPNMILILLIIAAALLTIFLAVLTGK